MKKYNIKLFFVLFSVILAKNSFAQNSDMTNVKFSSFHDSLSYVLGTEIGKSVRTGFIEKSIDLNFDLITKGLFTRLKDTVDLFTNDQKKEILEKFQLEMQQIEKQKLYVEAEINKKAGIAFLAENKKKPGVVELPDGLQYKIIRMGTGKSPNDTDNVSIHYVGKFITGEVFDSSRMRTQDIDQPITFKLNGVIQGFVEGLKYIKEGGKIELFIPSELAYGDRPVGEKIKAGSTLIFEVELIRVGDNPNEEDSPKEEKKKGFFSRLKRR